MYAFRPAAALPQTVSTHYIDAPYSRLSISNVVIPQVAHRRAHHQRPETQLAQHKSLNEIKSYLPESEKPMYKFILGSKHGNDTANPAFKTIRRRKGKSELKLIIQQ